MAYECQNFVDGQVLTAECLNRIERALADVCNKDPEPENGEAVLYTPQELSEEQKAQARENIGIVEKEDSNEFAVLYTEQSLTEEQKAQARENIGIVEKEESPELAVLYSEQSLTEEQKAQARENIGAVAVGEVAGGSCVFKKITFHDRQSLYDFLMQNFQVGPMQVYFGTASSMTLYPYMVQILQSSYGSLCFSLVKSCSYFVSNELRTDIIQIDILPDKCVTIYKSDSNVYTDEYLDEYWSQYGLSAIVLYM